MAFFSEEKRIKQMRKRQPLIRSRGLRYKKTFRDEYHEDQTGESIKAAPTSPSIMHGKNKDGYFVRIGYWRKSRFYHPRRLWLTIGCLVMVLGLAGLLIKTSLFQRHQDNSNKKFLAGKMNSKGIITSYGYGPVDIVCRKKAMFKFNYENGRVLLGYYIGGVDIEEEVEIWVNNTFFGFAPITMNQWSDYQEVRLSRKLMKERTENFVSFVNAVNQRGSKDTEEWGVRVLSITEHPLPPADIAIAQESFQIAEQRYRAKNVAPENLFQALGYFQNAMDYLELLSDDKRPGIYGEAMGRIEEIESELNERRRDLLFAAEQAKEFGRWEQAKDHYRELMQTFPQPQDPRHIMAKEELEMLSGK